MLALLYTSSTTCALVSFLKLHSCRALVGAETYKMISLKVLAILLGWLEELKARKSCFFSYFSSSTLFRLYNGDWFLREQMQRCIASKDRGPDRAQHQFYHILLFTISLKITLEPCSRKID